MCDCLLALGPAADGDGALFAKNSDRPPGEAQAIEWVAARRDDGPVRATYIDVDPHRGDTIGTLLSRPVWQWGAEHGVNEAGVAAGNEMIFTKLDPRAFPPALTGMDLVRLGLERATNAADAVAVMIDLLERYGQGGSGHEDGEHPYWSSFLVADAGEGWVLETSGRAWASERIGRTRAISNRTTIFEFDAANRHPRQPVETLVDPRLRASDAVLAAQPVTVADVKRHLRTHVGEQGYTICMHAPEQHSTASLIAELPRNGKPPLTHVLLGWPCRSVYVPLYVGRPIGDPLTADRFLPLRPAHRRALDELERSLLADAKDNDEWAPEAWGRVERAVRALAV